MPATRHLLAVLAAASIYLAGAPSASAWRVTFDPWAVGLQAAAMTWGGQPPCGTPTFAHHQATPDALGQAFEMEVAVDTTSFTTLAASDCVIRVSEYGESADPGQRCADIVHEEGHLEGREHSDDPGDVMFPGSGFGASWACQKLLRAKGYAQQCRRAKPAPDAGYSRATDCRTVVRWSLRAS